MLNQSGCYLLGALTGDLGSRWGLGVVRVLIPKSFVPGALRAAVGCGCPARLVVLGFGLPDPLGNLSCNK